MRITQNGNIITITAGYGVGTDGTVYPNGCPDGVDGVNHPALSGPMFSEEGRASLGVADVAEQARPDDRFYIVTDNGDGTYTADPRDLATLKADLVAELKRTANGMLAATDWMIVREAEGVKPCSQAVKEYRALVRAASNDNEAAIAGKKTVATLAAFVSTWPEPLA